VLRGVVLPRVERDAVHVGALPRRRRDTGAWPARGAAALDLVDEMAEEERLPGAPRAEDADRERRSRIRGVDEVRERAHVVREVEPVLALGAVVRGAAAGAGAGRLGRGLLHGYGAHQVLELRELAAGLVVGQLVVACTLLDRLAQHRRGDRPHVVEQRDHRRRPDGEEAGEQVAQMGGARAVRRRAGEERRRRHCRHDLRCERRQRIALRHERRAVPHEVREAVGRRCVETRLAQPRREPLGVEPRAVERRAPGRGVRRAKAEHEVLHRDRVAPVGPADRVGDAEHEAGGVGERVGDALELRVRRRVRARRARFHERLTLVHRLRGHAPSPRSA